MVKEHMYCNVAVVGSIPTRGDSIIYNFFHFFILEPKQNHGIMFGHSTHNASNNSAESREHSVLTLGTYPVAYAGYSMKLIFKYFLINMF